MYCDNCKTKTKNKIKTGKVLLCNRCVKAYQDNDRAVSCFVIEGDK